MTLISSFALGLGCFLGTLFYKWYKNKLTINV